MKPSLFLRPTGILLASLFLSSCLMRQGVLFAKEEAPFPQNTGAQPPECKVKNITKLATDGTRPDWSPDGRLIFYDGFVKGTHELLHMNVDGSNQRCLTCSAKLPQALRGKHKGFVNVHSDAKHIVFIAENEYGNHRFTNTPGIGNDNDFWVTDFDGNNFWRLTSLPQGWAIQFPHPSFDGTKFLWSERYEKGNVLRKGREYGFWKLKIADFGVTTAGPKFTNAIELQPGGKGFYEPHGFSPDGKTIILTAVLDPTKSQYYGEIYTFDLTTRKLTNLAKADNLHFEQAFYTPSGKKISFMAGPFIGLTRFAYKTDLYLMDADGSNRVRLTYFNEPGRPEYTGADTLINRHKWHPDGTKLASGHYIYERKEMSLFILTFQGPCGKL